MSVVTKHGSRVLMVSARYFPDMGGIETHVYEVGRRLVQQGMDVTVLTTIPQGANAHVPLDTESGGMKILRVRAWSHSADLCIAPAIYSAIKNGAWDLVHCQGIHTLVPPLAMLAAQRAKIPFVVTFHTGGHSSSLRNNIRTLQWRVLRPLLANAAQLVGVSQFEAKYFSQILRFPLERFTVIPNGATMPEVDRSLLAPRNGTLIVSPGRLERYKGHQHMIKALPLIRERCPDARLLILGAGVYKSELQALATSMGVNQHVEIRVIPAGNRQEMAATLMQASLVTLMSDYEAHPVAIMEALALGRPVLSIHTAGSQELAELGLIRTVPLKSSSKVIAAAVLEQLKHPLVPAAFSLPTWDECAEKLLTVYERAAPQKQLLPV